MEGTTQFVLGLLVSAPPLLLSLTMHEFAHARVALAFGDPTAKYMGRVTLNPLAHLDPLGTICMFISGFIGWAKPVPVNPANLHPHSLGNLSVSIAGVTANLILAMASGVTLRIALPLIPSYYLTELTVPAILMAMLLSAMMSNVGMFVFNLVPLFPLDGSHVLQELLPLHMQHRYVFWQRKYGAFFLLALIFGPQVLERVSGGHTIDPLGYLFWHVFNAFFQALHFPTDGLRAMGELLQLLHH